MVNGAADPDRLYTLLPALYRERDEAEGFPLRALLRLINGQADLLRSDIQQLWDNFFIETCKRWAIPYIGDLVGNNLPHDTFRTVTPDTARALFTDLVGVDLRPPIALRNRADVAKTIYYRRRKGSLPMLEELARDVTGWAAHAVEFFEHLVWTQCIRNHLKMNDLGTPDIRWVEHNDRLNGPFERMNHTVDVRAINPLNGWYNIKNVGFFAWRLGSYELIDVRARPSTQRSWGFHFSVLGNPAPLFSRWRREGDESGLATEFHVPGPVRGAFFYEDLQQYLALTAPRPAHTELYGFPDPTDDETAPLASSASFCVVRNGQPILPVINPSANEGVPQVVCRRLNPWPTAQPSGQVVAIDVASGRIAIGDKWADETESIDVSYHYGFSADLGGGPYERARWLIRPDVTTLRLRVQQGGPSGTFSNVGDALAEWINQGRPNTTITILDNRTYAEPLDIELGDEPASHPDGNWLVIQADNHVRPHLRPDGDVMTVSGKRVGAEITLSGLVVEGALAVDADLHRVRLLHSTLVPGRSLGEDGKPRSTEPSLVVKDELIADEGSKSTINAKLRVEIAFCIVGPLQVPTHAEGLWILDSIVQGLGTAPRRVAISAKGGAGPPTALERATVFGSTHVKQLSLASETIFAGLVKADRRQGGCVRFSYVSPGSSTPRRYRCQPDLEIAAQLEHLDQQAQASKVVPTPAERQAIRQEVGGWLVPSFTSTRYGDPAYGQLHLACPLQIRTGAEDESEMGVFCHLKQPQRETNLRLRLDEYLPFGLEAGIIYVT